MANIHQRSGKRDPPGIATVSVFQDLTMASASSLPTVNLPLTALYSGAVGVLFALLSLRAFLYRGSKGAKAYFGDQNIPAAPKLQSVVRVRGTHSESACMLHASFLKKMPDND